LHYSKTQILQELERRKETQRRQAMELLKQRGVAIPEHLMTAATRPLISKNAPDNLYDFVEMIRATLRVDNEPFTWTGHEYLLEPYKAFQLHPDKEGRNEDGLSAVWMCGAQVGKTIGGFLLLVWLAMRFWGKYFGYFLPDQAMAMIFSDVRFKPTVRSIPEIKPLWGEDPTADAGEQRKTDQKRVRSLGPSQIFFSYMQGKTSTESIPMLGVLFDEVRRMLDGDIERAMERISHSPYPIDFKFSTAGYPDANIDKHYKLSNQHRFHSKCKCNGKDGVVLADVFPNCIGEKSQGMTPSLRHLPDTFYICPICKEPIINPREGLWIPHNPDSKVIGYHIPQTLSCRQNAEKMLKAYQEASDLQEFFNSKLGIAYLAPESQIVNDTILHATVNDDIKWLTRGQNFAMGVDQMGGFNVITIRYWGPKDPIIGTSKSRLAHIEVVYDDDPWKRCDQMMEQYDINVCVVDALPNINEARRFAKRWKGRVWLADYTYNSQGDGDICIWGDRPKDTNSERKSGDEIKNKYTCKISRYHGIEWNLMKYVHRLKEQPNELALEATVQDNVGRPVTLRLCKAWFWVHLQKVARRKVVIDEKQGKFKMVFENIGLDPHFLHADLYCELALSRIKPDGHVKAFSDFSEEVKRALGQGEHDWRQQENPQHHRCEVCAVTVRVLADQTAQEVAEKKGWGICGGKV
jgi:hypothetical protein